MRDFINEYGLVILAVILILVLIAFATPLGSTITGNIEAVVGDFLEAVNKFFTAARTSYTG